MLSLQEHGISEKDLSPIESRIREEDTFKNQPVRTALMRSWVIENLKERQTH